MDTRSATAPDPGSRVADPVLPWRFWWGLAACAGLVGLIMVFAPYSAGVNIEPDRGNWWYYWQRADADAWSRLSAWLPYTAHQLAMWFLIARARTARPRYVFGLHWFNVWALAVNGGFILLHIAQTKLFYDGLAQDVHEMTSMGSVTLMLFMILVMENRRRGMFFGVPAPFMETAGETLRRYHGFYFSWAIVYTFWYHPVEITAGHLAGFAYMFLLFLQGSLFFTRFHVNRKWTMFLEVLFVVHGATVAGFILNRGETGPWSMFLFGGTAVFLITQLHGIGLSTRGKLAVALPLLAVMGAFYAMYPENLAGVTRMPGVLYTGAFLMAGTVWLLARGARLVGGAAPGAGSARAADGPGAGAPPLR
jgi:hypothetical protein